LLFVIITGSYNRTGNFCCFSRDNKQKKKKKLKTKKYGEKGKKKISEQGNVKRSLKEHVKIINCHLI